MASPYYVVPATLGTLCSVILRTQNANNRLRLGEPLAAESMIATTIRQSERKGAATDQLLAVGYNNL